MRFKWIASSLISAGLALGVPGVASAQTTRNDTQSQERRGADYPPPPQAPPLAAGVAEQAGLGSGTAYARAGVLELGGSAGFSAASNFTQLNISPTVGWFFIDNVQLSGIIGLNYVNTGGGRDSTYFTLLAEPSYHLPISDRLFGFLGVGVGIGYASGGNVGFALAPRLGANIMVGRSGILTPALTFAYNTSNTVQTPQGNALTVDTLFGVNIGYTVMW